MCKCMRGMDPFVTGMVASLCGRAILGLAPRAPDRHVGGAHGTCLSGCPVCGTFLVQLQVRRGFKSLASAVVQVKVRTGS